MTPGRAGRSLAERAARSGVLPGDAQETREGRHCWVRDPPGSPGTWPGLLVEWRQSDGAWQGRVAYTVSGPHGLALVEAWVPAARLEPR